WTLARMSGSEKDWLLLKKADGAAASDELVDRYPQSILSGLTVEEMADVPGRLACIRQHVDTLDAPRREVPAGSQPFMLATLDGHDLRRLPLTRRKDCLRLLVPPLGPVHYVDHVLEHGPAFLEAANEQRLEGIVAKKAASSYAGGRSRDWIKVKCQRRQEFVIGGYTDPQGSRGHFGALHIGVYDGARLVYVSKVGTGFDQ